MKSYTYEETCPQLCVLLCLELNKCIECALELAAAYFKSQPVAMLTDVSSYIRLFSSGNSLFLCLPYNALHSKSFIIINIMNENCVCVTHTKINYIGTQRDRK